MNTVRSHCTVGGMLNFVAGCTHETTEHEFGAVLLLRRRKGRHCGVDRQTDRYIQGVPN